jgi:hypothetical protein
MQVKFKRPALAVAGFTAAALIISGGTAEAARLITGSDVKNGSLTGADIKNGSLRLGDINAKQRAALKGKNGTNGKNGVNGTNGKDGATGATGATGAKGDKGDKGDTGATGAQRPAGSPAETGLPNWGDVHRNILGNGDSDLGVQSQKPPLGVGALNVRTGSNTDKAAFGNEVDFRGVLVNDLNAVGFSVFTTGENNARGNNMPAITFEIDPNITNNGSNFSSLVYVPSNGASNQWTAFDAAADPDNHWGLTGAQFAATKCSLNGTRCTLAEVKALLNDGGDPATVLTVAIGKGTDFAFSGAVDALRINAQVFDFESFGVRAVAP